jgi:hypothetical protein
VVDGGTVGVELDVHAGEDLVQPFGEAAVEVAAVALAADVGHEQGLFAGGAGREVVGEGHDVGVAHVLPALVHVGG